MFKHILVPFDGSPMAENVISSLLALAQAFDAKVSLIRVLERPQSYDRNRPFDPLEWQMCKVEARSYLDHLSDQLLKAGLEVEMVMEEGTAAGRIIEFVNAHDIDLIVASTHGQSGFTGWNVGAVMQKIIARARISLLIIPSYKKIHTNWEESPFKKILVALDGSKRAEYVLAPIVRLTQYYGAQLMLGHVVRRPEMPRQSSLTQEDLNLANQLTDRNQQEAEKYLESLKSRLSIDVQIRLLVSNDVVNSLQDLAIEEDINLVVVCAHGYGTNHRWRYGSVASAFIENGDRSLLVVQDIPAEKMKSTYAEAVVIEYQGH